MTTVLGLLRRYLRHMRGGAIALSVLTLAVTLIALVIPVTFSSVSADEVRSASVDGPPSHRYLVAHPDYILPENSSSTVETEPAYDDIDAELFGAFRARLASVRQEFPAAVREATGPALWTVAHEPVQISKYEPRTDPQGAVVNLAVRVEPTAESHVRIVEGEWPRTDELDTPRPPTTKRPLEIALSSVHAHMTGWEVGERRKEFVLTAIFEPLDPTEDFWAINEGMLAPNVIPPGNGLPIVTASAFADPQPLLPV